MKGASLWFAGPAAMASCPPMLPVLAAPVPVTPTLHAPPDPAQECLKHAHAALAVGNQDAALGWFRNAAALDASPMPRLGAAICLLEMGRDDEAEIELSSAYELSVRPGDVDVALARIFYLGGQRQAAFNSLGLAIETDQAWAAVVRDDRAFGNLRDHPSFLQVVGEI